MADQDNRGVHESASLRFPKPWKTAREKLLEAIDGGLVESATEFATQRGFHAARVRQVEAEIHEVRGELGFARRQVDNLEAERALRERFVSMLSHDLRTPLTAVKASADLILRRADDPERH